MSKLITSTRVLLIPVIVLLVSQQTSFYLTLAIFLFLLAITLDLIYHFLGSKLSHSKVGSFLDPFSDKILVFSLLLLFTLANSFSRIAFILFLVRDLISAVIRWMAARDEAAIKSESYNRLLTYSQYALILSLLVHNWLIYNKWRLVLIYTKNIIVALTVLALILAATSAVYYLMTYIKNLSHRKIIAQDVKAEKCIILANRRSRGYHDGYRRRLLKLFAKRREEPILFLPSKRDMFDKMSKSLKAKLNSTKQVIIAGGDGSFEGALNYPPLNRHQLGFFPLGAGNAYYSYFYKNNRYEYLRSRFKFKQMDLDILEMKWDSGKIQTTFLSLGVDAEVLGMNTLRTTHGFSDYLKGSLKTLIQGRSSYNLTCKLDAKTLIWDNCVNVTIAKIPYYGYGLRSLFGPINPSDGLVYGMAVVNTHSKILNHLVRAWGLVLTAFGLNKPPLYPFKAGKIIISSQHPFPIQAGGEYLGYTKSLEVRVIRKQKVLVI